MHFHTEGPNSNVNGCPMERDLLQKLKRQNFAFKPINK